jgi:hypothetical protein
MPLLDLWKSNAEAVLTLTVEQVLSAAGDGQLKDGSTCSSELRRFLGEVPTEKLAKYLDHCLAIGFTKSGHVLQDLVNELGRRLDYQVENGLYQGKVNAIGYDGLWIAPDQHGLVIEVKTTDAYRINLDTLAKYRTALIQAGKLGPKSSVLIVVGRQDTGDIEAQVRGSRHAWDMRLISADALVRLVTLKEGTEEDETLAKIRSLLVPFESTRVDNIIDVVFATAKDVEAGTEVLVDDHGGHASGSGDPAQQQKHTPSHVLQALRGKIVAAMASKLGVQLVAQKRALHRSADGKTRIACAVSKPYEGGAYYWYAYHPAWKDFLAQGEAAFMVLGCVDRDVAYAVPVRVIDGALEWLHTTVPEGGKKYWHLVLEKAQDGQPVLSLPKKGERLSVAPYATPLQPQH